MLLQNAFDLSLAYLLAVVDASAILIPLRGHTYVDFAQKNMAAVLVLVVLGIIGVALGGVLILAPTLRWYVPGHEPTPQQREAAIKLGGRQSAILVGAWSACGAVLLLMNHADVAQTLLPVLLGVVLGGPAAAGTGFLLAQRTLRPIIGVATRGCQPRLAVPGVFDLRHPAVLRPADPRVRGPECAHSGGVAGRAVARASDDDPDVSIHF